MRILLLRLLIGWWVIPVAWLLLWPLLYLIGGVEDATETLKYTTKLYWYGNSVNNAHECNHGKNL